MLESESSVPRVEVHLADGRCVVAGIAHELRPSLNASGLVVEPDTVVVVRYAVADGVHPRQQRIASWDTDRRLRVGLLVTGTVFGDGVDIRCIDELRAVARQEVTPKLVRE